MSQCRTLETAAGAPKLLCVAKHDASTEVKVAEPCLRSAVKVAVEAHAVPKNKKDVRQARSDSTYVPSRWSTLQMLEHWVDSAAAASTANHGESRTLTAASRATAARKVRELRSMIEMLLVARFRCSAAESDENDHNLVTTKLRPEISGEIWVGVQTRRRNSEGASEILNFRSTLR
jgi:hypothetical protein